MQARGYYPAYIWRFFEENGINIVMEEGDVDGNVYDDYRIDYLRDHMKAMKVAVQNGVDLFGYTMWGAIDIVSNGTGQMSKRYGIIYVDLDDDGNGTGKRLKKKSYDFYRHIIETNGKEL